MSDINNANPNARWFEVDASNTEPAPDGFPQANGQDLWIDVPANGRALMGAIKRFWDRINGTITATGTAPQYVYTPSNTAFPLAYVQGETYTFRANFTSIGGDTLNVNALGALPLYKSTPAGFVPVVAGDIQIGQIVQAVYDSSLNSGSGAFQVVGGVSVAPSQAIPTTAGILTYANATSIVFSPKNGAYIKIDGVLVPIPATGLGMANTGVEVGGVTGQNLAANTAYDVYLKIVSGTLTPSFYVDAGGGTHMTDITAGNVGVEVRSNSGTPDSTRSLIGKVLTNASGQFINSPIALINWFNRRSKSQQTSAITASTTSSTISNVTINGAPLLTFLTWGDEAVSVRAGGYMSNSISSGVAAQATIDGTATGAYVSSGAISGIPNLAQTSFADQFIAEGQHTAGFGISAPDGGTSNCTITASISITG